MIEMKFYRDDEYVYINNPDGTTKRVPIEDFEAVMSGKSELPTYSSTNSGEVLSVDSDGDLEWTRVSGGTSIPVFSATWNGETLVTEDSFSTIFNAYRESGIVILRFDDSASASYTAFIVAMGSDGYYISFVDNYYNSNLSVTVYGNNGSDSTTFVSGGD